MSIPVLFFEATSAHRDQVTDDEALATAMKLVDSLVSLKKINKKIGLNSIAHLSKLEIAPGRTLSSILKGKSHTEEWLFLRSIVLRSPISGGLDEWIEEAGLWDVKTASNEDAVALTWANMCSTGTVSLHVHHEWMSEWVNAVCTTLDSNQDLITSSKRIQNISHPDHSTIHTDWLSTLGTSNIFQELWSERETRFPGLRFLGAVERQLAQIFSTGAPYLQAIETLKILNEDALRWQGKGEPSFSIKVAAGEHDQRRELAVFFDDLIGTNRDFGRHAYFTGGIAGRIHFLVDSNEDKFVVAYIGKKL